MNTEEAYRPVIVSINRLISSFNQFLVPDVRFKEIIPTDSTMFSDAAGIDWDNQHWPSKDSHGVYLLCGSNPDRSRFVAYVGKASHGVIGKRLWSHLHPQRSNQLFVVENYEKEQFPLQAIFTVSVPKGAPSGFASAFEEFILESGIEDVELVNAIGNK